MRGDEGIQDGIFGYVSLEQRVPADHPLRAVRRLTDAVLGTLSPEFDALYAASGRPSIAPEYILRALLLQVFCSVRSERLLVEQLDYNLLFRGFVGLGMDDAVWTMRCSPRTALWVAEAGRANAAGEVTRAGECGLTVRLQLRSAQPDPASQTYCSTIGNTQGAACLNRACRHRDRIPDARKR